MDQKIQALITKLSKWYWSPQLPNNYTLHNGNGIGKIAMNNPAAFNLTWAKYRGDFGDHVEPVSYFARVGLRLAAIQVNKQTLDSYVTLMSYQEFHKFYSQIRPSLSNTVAEVIDEAFHEKVQKL